MTTGNHVWMCIMMQCYKAGIIVFLLLIKDSLFVMFEVLVQVSLGGKVLKFLTLG